MKRLYYLTLTIATASLLLAGPVLGGGKYTHGSKTLTGTEMGAAAVETTKPEVSLNKEQIGELKRLLIERGYKVDATKGTVDESTKEAIRQFQTDEGLTVNGTADLATLRALSPDLKKQEFFGVAPSYGEKEPMKKGY